MRGRTGTVGFMGEDRRSCAAGILHTWEILIEEYDGLSLYETVFGLARGGGRRARGIAGDAWQS